MEYKKNSINYQKKQNFFFSNSASMLKNQKRKQQVASSFDYECMMYDWLENEKRNWIVTLEQLTLLVKSNEGQG